MNTITKLEEMGYNPMDKVCAFCMITTDRWNNFCPRCREYKGLMSVLDFANVYGLDELEMSR